MKQEAYSFLRSDLPKQPGSPAVVVAAEDGREELDPITCEEDADLDSDPPILAYKAPAAQVELVKSLNFLVISLRYRHDSRDSIEKI